MWWINENSQYNILYTGDALHFMSHAGDPAFYHAHSIAIVHQAEEGIPLQKLSAHGRIGSMVKKTILWCSVDEHGQPFYVSQNRGVLS
jgi:tRNA splicing endonuclease